MTEPSAVSDDNRPRVTILIPTYNRSRFLQRQLDYLHRKFARPFYTIHVLDGSSDRSEASENERLCLQHSVRYSWRDSESESAYSRLIHGAQDAQTDYVQMMPDDDYFNEEAIRRHVEIMDDRPDVSGVYGHHLGFRCMQAPKTGDTIVRLRYCASHQTTDYSFEHPLERVLYATMERSRSAYYALHRREVYLRAIQLAYRAGEYQNSSRTETTMPIDGPDKQSFYFGDVAFLIATLLWGKKVNSNLPMLAFQTGNSVDGPETLSPLPPRRPHHLLVLDPNFHFPDRARMFIDSIVREYVYIFPRSPEDALRDFFEALLSMFLGSRAIGTNSWAATYNAALAATSGPDDAAVKLQKGKNRLHGLWNALEERARCKLCDANHGHLCEELRRDFAFLVPELQGAMGAQGFQIVAFEATEVTSSMSLFSRVRPPLASLRRMRTTPDE